MGKLGYGAVDIKRRQEQATRGGGNFKDNRLSREFDWDTAILGFKELMKEMGYR